MLVYGRTDPKPGNFEPRFATTQDFIDIVNEATGQNLRWFFDVYLYQAALPELLVIREKQQLVLEWRTPEDLLFPMPVEVLINDNRVTLAMTSGQETVRIPDGAQVTVDPHSKILRYSAAIEEFRAWEKAQEKASDAE